MDRLATAGEPIVRRLCFQPGEARISLDNAASWAMTDRWTTANQQDAQHLYLKGSRTDYSNAEFSMGQDTRQATFWLHEGRS
jgi:hypothetical protein